MIYLELYWSFFQIGLFSFGGGMAAVPLIQAQVVDVHGWLSLTEFTDLITIAEMTPGPIAVNSATFVGIQVADLLGAIVATLGCITPSSIIALTLVWLYTKYSDLFILKGMLLGLRPAIVSLIASAGVTILVLALFGETGIVMDVEAIDYVALLLFAGGLFVLRRWKSINPIKVMMSTGIIGGMIYWGMGMV